MTAAVENNRVLLVESDDSIQRIVSYHLKKAGYEAEFAETGDQAIALSHNPPVCVVIDLMIPGASGMTVLKHFREQLPQVPVIAMAGRGEASEGLTAIRLGAFDYVTKPLMSEHSLQPFLRRFVRGIPSGNRSAICRVFVTLSGSDNLPRLAFSAKPRPLWEQLRPTC